MTIKERIDGFEILGDRLRNISREEFDELSFKVENSNGWFTKEEVRNAIHALASTLTKKQLENWIFPYRLEEVMEPKSIGVLMAGNIPAVGFHDMLCVLIAGHRCCLKLSSTDQVLIKWIVDQLVDIQPKFAGFISIEEMLKSKDAYIATGSDNSARYFEYYFGKYPHIIRKNRTSVGVLDGRETREDFLKLGKDIFQYYGLGCRSISKIFVNDRSVVISLLDSLESFANVSNNHKYHNNYEYNKSIFLINNEDHLDNGFLMLRESESLFSPISVLHYEIFSDLEQLNEKLTKEKDKIQCLVSKDSWYPGSLKLGDAQCPGLNDYADGVDTIEFLKSL